MFASVKPERKKWTVNYGGILLAKSDRRRPVINDNIYTMMDRLLSFGGEAVCFDVNQPFFHEVEQFGQLWHGYAAVMKNMTPGRCHWNSAHVADNNVGYRFCTGYALNADGIWYNHSWCVTKNRMGTRTVETTGPRVMYYGYVLCNEDFKEFKELL